MTQQSPHNYSRENVEDQQDKMISIGRSQLDALS
jgi:hypothetical protein